MFSNGIEYSAKFVSKLNCYLKKGHEYSDRDESKIGNLKSVKDLIILSKGNFNIDVESYS